MEKTNNNHEQDKPARYAYCKPELVEVTYGELVSVEGVSSCPNAVYQQTGEEGCTPDEFTPEYSI